MTETLNARIARLEKLDRERTPGDWASTEETHGCEVCTIHGLNTKQGWAYIRSTKRLWSYEYKNDGDIKFIAAAPEMMDVIREQRRLLGEAVESMSIVCDAAKARDVGCCREEARRAITKLQQAVGDHDQE